VEGDANPMKRLAAIFMLSLGLLVQQVSPVFADGIIIPEPPLCDDDCFPIIEDPMKQLEIIYHHVDVDIEDQIATIHVDQVFYNPNEYDVEGQYIFPIPKDASINEFVMWMDNEPIKGKVLDAEQARATYESIVNQMKDPALLEYIGQGAVQASIYPIPSGEERRIELEYTQVLTSENGLVDFIYPLNTEKFSLQNLDEVSVTVEITSKEPLRAIYSPSHTVSIQKEDQYHASISYEETDVLPDQDFELLYSVGKEQAVHLFTYLDATDQEDKDGYFLLLLAPPIKTEGDEVEKDVVLIMDRSGSMEGEKFEQAQDAAKTIMKSLNENDRFYISTFSDQLNAFNARLQPASKAADAVAWVDRQSAAGSTDINFALLDALAIVDTERPTYFIFLTDGLPTAGEVESDTILRNFSLAVPENVRFFSFGVGYDVDTMLLDTLSQENHGSSSYVTPDESLDEVLSGFYEKISSPVLTNLEMEFDGMTVYDVYPSPLPDLFSGNQVIITGRYKKGGDAALHLSGEVNGNEQTFTYSDLAFSKGTNKGEKVMDQLARIWATRKVGYLLREIRLNGMNEELIAQVIQLSVRYGIVTEYTSYLVEEPSVLGMENQHDLANEAMKEYESMPSPEVSGMGAVQRASDEGALSAAESAPVLVQEGRQTVQNVGNRTFVLQDERWVDTMYDETKMNPEKISFLSDAYMELLNLYPEAQKYLALGDKMILVLDGKAYEIVPEDEKLSYWPSREDDVPVNTEPMKSENNSLAQLSCLPGSLILVLVTLFIRLH
jgi:Ca-activated chloride channel homolog